MTYGGRGFSAPGPRTLTTRTENTATELLLVIKQVIAGALFLNVLIAIPQAAALILQEWTLLALGIAFLVMPALAVRMFTQWWKTKWGHPRLFYFCMALTTGGLAGPCFAQMDSWWAWHKIGLAALGECVGALFAPYTWWMLLLLGVIWLLGAIKSLGKVALAFDFVLTVAWGWAYHTTFVVKLPLLRAFTVGVLLDPQPFATVVQWAKWILLPHGIPWVFFSFVGALRMFAEAYGAGALPITLMPAKVGEVSFLDLLLPGLRTKSLSKASDLEIAHVDRVYTERGDARPGEAKALSSDFPLPSRHKDKGYIGFFKLLRALLLGESLTWDLAKRYGYKQREYRGWDDAQGVHYSGVREALEDLQYGTEQPDKTFSLHDEFYQWAAPKVAQQFGLDSVPEEWQSYTTPPPQGSQ